MDISLQGYNAKYATFIASIGLKAGDLVSVSANNQVSSVTSGKFVGVVRSVRGNYALVQTSGYVSVPYSGGTAPSLGFQSIAAAAGGVASSDSGREVIVTSVDSVNKSVGILF